MALLGLAACSPPSGSEPDVPVPMTTQAASPSNYSKVLIVMEENKKYDQVIGSPFAPYLNRLARTYGQATAMDAGYPAHCPSLAAYIILTSGADHGICDDRSPAAHPLAGPSIFSQVAASGQQWRSYAENMPAACMRTNSADGRYLVRHVPATYYTAEQERCRNWTVPLGQRDSTPPGAFSADLAAGRLPAYGMVTPDACDDMHGADGCQPDHVAQGDGWLARWMPQILAGPDYRAGRLAIIVTWDEGSRFSNHIATLVISPTTQGISSARPFTHCSTLRTTEEILRLPLLGCAASAPSMRGAFHL